MANSFTRFLALALLALSFAPAWAKDPYGDAARVFRKAGESGEFFSKSYGYALFPTIGKGGAGIGGAYGKGRVYVKGKVVGDTSMTQLTAGLQLGGQAYSQIIFFEDEHAFKEFTGGNFEFGADASAVAIRLVRAPRVRRRDPPSEPASPRTTPGPSANTTRAWRSSPWRRAA